jgi:hypothetical protein
MKIKEDYISPKQRVTHTELMDKFIVSISFVAFIVQLVIFLIS